MNDIRRCLSEKAPNDSKAPDPTTSSVAADAVSAKKESKITWMRGYLGAHSNTDPPNAMFIGVAAIVTGAGFYAWFIEPPVPN